MAQNIILPSEQGFDVDCLNYTVHVNPVDGVIEGVMPTDAQLRAEGCRLRMIELSLENGGVIDDHRYADALVRHHTVTSVRSGSVSNNNIVLQIKNLEKNLENVMKKGFDSLDRRLKLMETQSFALTSAINARFSNHRLRQYDDWVNRNYVPVVKYLSEHPFARPDVTNLGILFDTEEYLVNSQPPPNLLPTNYNQLLNWRDDDSANTLWRRLSAVFWFYNDPRLSYETLFPNMPPLNQQHPNPNREDCRAAMLLLDNFLRHP